MVTIGTIEEIKNKVAKKNNTFQRKLQNRLINVSPITNTFGETLTRVDGEIPINLKVNQGDRFLFISYEQTRFTHGIHKYPAKFFPELPRWLIKKYSKENDIILDPFGGSATTSIEALLNRRNSVSVDIDPFARFLSKVKTTKLDNEELEIYSNILIKKITEFKINNELEKYIPNFPYRDNWFNKEIIWELAFIKKSISELKISAELNNFFLATFSSIIRNVSNADNNCTRTVIRKKLNKQIYPSIALTKFVENLLLYKSRIEEFNKYVPENIIAEIDENSDAREINYGNNYFDFAITSPPYVNAVDYPRTHQLEIYWLEIENGSLTPLKKKHIGTESVTVKHYNTLHKINVPAADEKIKSIYEIDKRRAYIAYKFLNDMEKNIREVNRTLKKDGRYAIVIGNNTIRGHNFESWKYLMEIAKRNNFEIENFFGSEIIKHFIKIKRTERINTDWIIILRKKWTMKITKDDKANKGKQASIDGFAHEHIVVGILMKKFQNVSLVDLPLSSYDIIIARKIEGEDREDIIRVQVKTSRKSISFTGGTRGGVDREYKSDVKTYTQSPKTSDVIIGIKPNENTDGYSLYFVPTILIAEWGTKSKSLKQIEALKDNYDFLINCKNHQYIITKAKELNII